MLVKPLLSFSLAILLSLTTWVQAQENINATVSQAWQMLDYLATDYAGAVENGKVVNPAEYQEMQEFAQTILGYVQGLPQAEGHQALVQQSQELVEHVQALASTDVVAAVAHELGDGLLFVYPIPTAPSHAPDLAQGAKLYQEHCTACHGVSGAADTDMAKSLEPAPIAFTDVARANQRSPLSLYQTTSQGVDGTSMKAFPELSETQRWALAYYVGSLAYTSQAAAGAQLWNSDALIRAQIGNLNELSRARAEQLFPVLGEEKSQQVVGYLRAHPEELAEAETGLALARGRLQASLRAYQAGDKQNAITLALSAYLDGVEPVEPLLNARAPKLRSQIELSMGAYRTSLSKDAQQAQISALAQQVDDLLQQALAVVEEGNYSAGAIFLGAFTILLREGLEALLIIIAILAFLNRANRPEVLPYVHLGWISALVLGVATWVVARFFIDISGASRELTEGFSAFFAAVMLLSVGLWMHQKSVGDAWQVYLKEKMGAAMGKNTAWFLFLLAFISVYREVFETILFYAALWVEGQESMMLAGMLSAGVLLALIAWLLLRTSKKIPIATFFSASSALIAILVVVLTGKGVAALQEAGWIDVTLAPLPAIGWLGMTATWQTAAAQIAVLVVLVLGYFYNKRNQ
ncbi:MAG: hypothetical protein RL217_1386 [Pseudomonadota bacterium]|jgi:high-affinity iron transporter